MGAEGDSHDAATGAPRTGLARLILGTQPSALELLAGPDEYVRQIRIATLRWSPIMAITTLVAAVIPGPRVAHFHAGALAAVSLVGLAYCAGLAVVRRRVSPVFYVVSIAFLIPGIVGAMWLAGPSLQVAAAALVSGVAVLFIFWSRRTAIVLSLQVFVLYAIVVSTRGYPRPVTHWVYVFGFSVAAAVVIDHVVQLLRVLSDREREATTQLEATRAALAEANTALEGRVADQVSEIDRLGRLRRFLSPQVADTIMSAGGEGVLATHRALIAAFFCDLRGFTRFSASAQPEDVVEVLNEYFEAVGRRVETFGATVGGFAGDGIMVYFNDPFPVDDPADKAVGLAFALRAPMRALSDKWRARGYHIAHGIGIAYGYATLSTIGFETRSEYTAFGPVVNLAARLCDQASPGEILVDARAYAALRAPVEGEERSVRLKGFNDAMTAYSVFDAAEPLPVT